MHTWCLSGPGVQKHIRTCESQSAGHRRGLLGDRRQPRLIILPQCPRGEHRARGQDKIFIGSDFSPGWFLWQQQDIHPVSMVLSLLSGTQRHFCHSIISSLAFNLLSMFFIVSGINHNFKEPKKHLRNKRDIQKCLPDVPLGVPQRQDVSLRMGRPVSGSVSPPILSSLLFSNRSALFTLT